MTRKTFTTEQATSADVQTYLMNQIVDVCTSATRNGSPIEGMLDYETDTDISNFYDGTNWVPAGQAGRAWTFIQETALGSDTTLALSLIPATFEHLMVELSVRQAVAEAGNTTWMRVNGDSGANKYDWVFLYGDGTTVASSKGNSVTGAAMGRSPGTTPTSAWASATLYLPYYRDTNRYKSWHCTMGNANTSEVYAILAGGQWRDTSAVTSLSWGSGATVFSNATFKQFSTATLYGAR